MLGVLHMWKLLRYVKLLVFFLCMLGCLDIMWNSKGCLCLKKVCETLQKCLQGNAI